MLENKEKLLEVLSQYNENDDNVYLVNKFCDDAGLFIKSKKYLYMVKSESEKLASIKTDYLNIFLKVRVSPITTNSQFPAGEYDILEFNRDVHDDVFDSFLELCYLHSQNIGNVKFSDFFKSLISLFQTPHEQQYKNYLGLYGEISFLVNALKSGRNLIDNWHTGEEANAKYDLVFNKANADIKTILSKELIVTLKHDQLFNSDENYLVVMQLEKNNSGKTLRELIDYLQNNDEVRNNYMFWLKLENEKMKIDKRKLSEEKLSFVKCYVFYAKDVNPFNEIPNNITKLNYDMDLSESELFIDADAFLKLM